MENERILRISKDNFDRHLVDLIALSDEFLTSLGESPFRTPEEKRAILEEMVSSPQTTILMMVDSEDAGIGLSYYNDGTGYSCGGRYVWINGVYIREAHRGRGLGSSILRWIEKDARQQGATLVMSTRDSGNVASEKMFSKESYDQADQVVIKKDGLG